MQVWSIYIRHASQSLIHRDVKTTNILLYADIEAKISDFGLMKVFADEFRTHITTQPAGTLGYLDPEYYNTSRLSEKIDVYSFGVVLLELITGQPPAVPISDTESIHIPRWVHEKLSVGEIESIADQRMGEYDVNNVWKVIELALQCIERPSHERPTMTEVVLELKESMAPELLHAMGYYSSAPSSIVDISETNIDLQSGAQASDARQETMLELEKLGDGSATHMRPAP
jgi:serine/threonine protein kinase